MSNNKKGIIVVLVCLVAGVTTLYFVEKNKQKNALNGTKITNMKDALIVLGFLSNPKNYEEAYIISWADARANAEPTFSYKDKSYSSNTGRLIQ